MRVAHLDGELSGNDATGVMDVMEGHDRCGWQAVLARRQTAGDGSQRGKVRRLRKRRIETLRRHAAAGQHDVMAQRMVVAWVRQRADQRPFAASRGEPRQMLANLNARRARANRAEFAADIVGSVGLGIETVVLRETAGEEEVDDRVAGESVTARIAGLERL